MLKYNRILCLLLALLMVLPMLVACKKDTGNVDIVADGGTTYTIVYPNKKSAATEKSASEKLAKAILEATGVKITADADWMPATANSTEIVVGETNRPESERATEGLRSKDFVIRYDNGRVVILGGSAAATAAGVDHFIANYIHADKKAVTVNKEKEELVRFDYMLGTVKVGEVPITDYTLVYPENADLITKYIAYNISDYFLTNAGYELKITDDSAAETKYEILIGKTNRAASASAVNCGSGEYAIWQSGDKIVLQGESYMIGAAAGALVNDYIKPAGANADVKLSALPTVGTAIKHTFKKATSAILMIGDGMGFNHIKAAEEIGVTDFVANRLPGTSAVTYSQSVTNGEADFTDSAAAATALATGYKTLNGYVGVDPNGTTRQNVRELAHALGAKTAVVTTDAITGATPSGFLCHGLDRKDTTGLQKQINALRESGGVTYAEGGFAEKEMTTYVRKALESISGNGSQFFAMFEEAHIDKHSHNNDLAKAQLAVKYYDDAIAYVIGFTMMHPETALIITADHETGELYADVEGGPLKYHFDDHSNVDVPLFAIGDGTDTLIANERVNNIEIAKFLAGIFGAETFGQ